AVRDGVEQHRRVQHVVVEAEVVDGYDVEAGLAGQLPMPCAQPAGLVEQVGGIGVAAPVAFEGMLELSSEPDARKAGNGYLCHVEFLLKKGARGTKEMAARLPACMPSTFAPASEPACRGMPGRAEGAEAWPPSFRLHQVSGSRPF